MGIIDFFRRIFQGKAESSEEAVNLSDEVFEKPPDPVEEPAPREASSSYPTDQPPLSQKDTKKQQEKLPSFSEQEATTAWEAINILFDEAIVATPRSSPEQVQQEYQLIEPRWGSQILVEGSENEVKPIVYGNLQRLEKRENFSYFSIEVYPKHKYTQVNASFGKKTRRMFVGMRVWRSKDRFFACGDEEFS